MLRKGSLVIQSTTADRFGLLLGGCVKVVLLSNPQRVPFRILLITVA